jgi:hypothetical protein
MQPEICEIELVTRLIDQNDVSDESSQSLTLQNAIDEQCVECGVVLMQPSQQTHDNTNVDESRMMAVMKQY